MIRRKFLGLASAAAAGSSFPLLQGAEPTGRWTEERMQEVSLELFNWLRGNFELRAKELERCLGEPFALNYQYLAPTEDRAKLRLLEKFEKQSLSKKAFHEHLVASLEDFEKVRVELAAAEQAAVLKWEGKVEDLVAKGGTVYDTEVTAGKLCVVLDSSRSMTPYLVKLRAEISKDFADAYFVEVDGCDLKREAHSPWFFSAPREWINPFTADRHIPKVPSGNDAPYSTLMRWRRDAAGALDCMVDLMGSDAIYWFCDFDDPTDNEVIKKFGRNLLKKNVRLYVHTLGKRPPELIQELADRSGGKVIRKRV